MATAARPVRLAAALAAAAACTACLDTSTLITVKPDGSGTISSASSSAPTGWRTPSAGWGSSPRAESAKKTAGPTAGDLRADAARVGDGVTLVSVEPVTAADGFQGALATYSFRDIRKVRADAFLMPGPQGAAASAYAGDSRTAFSFTTTPQGTALLTLVFDERPGKKAKSGDATPTTSPDIGDAKTREMVKAIFKGFRMGLDLEVAGDIVRTNADHVNGRRITLMAVDMEALLADEAKLKTLDQLSPGASLAEVRPLLAGMDGIRINKPIVKVEFR